MKVYCVDFALFLLLIFKSINQRDFKGEYILIAQTEVDKKWSL